MFTLVVNHAYEPLQVVGWEKAIYLVVTKKADLLVAYDRVIRSVSLTLQAPKVVRLKRHVQLKLRERGIYKKREVFERDNWICQYCGTGVMPRTATVDHVVPRSKGGATSWTNTATACSPCNARKANRTPEEAGMVLRSVPKRPDTGRAIREELQRAYEEFLAECL